MTFNDITKRASYLRGTYNYTTASTSLTVIKDHINFAVLDIVNLYPFSWNLITDDLTLSSGTATMSSDYNPSYHIFDARIVSAGADNDTIFEEIDIRERDKWGDGTHKYWITYDTATETYIFNSSDTSGTITIYYYFYPAAMVNTTDVCAVPDGEAVAYLAAAKMWVGDERNQQLAADYENKAMVRIKNMWVKDFDNQPNKPTGTPTDNMPDLQGD